MSRKLAIGLVVAALLIISGCSIKIESNDERLYPKEQCFKDGGISYAQPYIRNGLTHGFCIFKNPNI